MNKIKPNSKISLHYSLSLDDGTEIENNYGHDPLLCYMGDGTLTSGMEDALINLQINEEVESLISPEQGYGYPEKENIHSLPSSDFDKDIDIAVGQVIAFDGPDEDEEIPGTIVEIKNKEVLVDFSHPLAGRNILFKAKVIAIEQNDEES